MKVTTKGQVTIPNHIRGYLGITAHSEIDFVIRNKDVVLVKAELPAKDPASKFRRLRGILKGGLTTKQWMKLTRGD